MFKLVISAFLALILFVACSSDNGEEVKRDTDCNETTISLSADIVPIINTNCAVSGCHLNSQNPIMDTNEKILAAANRIASRTASGTMPPSGPLDANTVQLITDWVNCGPEDN